MKHGCCVDKTCTKDTCMELPEGITCGDCYHIKRCKAIYGHTETDTYCDWFPRRFFPAMNNVTKDGKNCDNCRYGPWTVNSDVCRYCVRKAGGGIDNWREKLRAKCNHCLGKGFIYIGNHVHSGPEAQEEPPTEPCPKCRSTSTQ